MKVIKIDNYSCFKAVGMEVKRMVGNIAYGIMSDRYNNGEVIYTGTKRQCEDYINSI